MFFIKKKSRNVILQRVLAGIWSFSPTSFPQVELATPFLRLCAAQSLLRGESAQSWGGGWGKAMLVTAQG